MKLSIILLVLSWMPFWLFAQFPVLSTFYDESNNSILDPETTIANEITANKGTCFFRSQNSSFGTMFYGPYISLPAGNYIATFRLKVASNSSANRVVRLDIANNSGGTVNGYIDLKPNMFQQSNKWEVFSLPFQILDGAINIEFRGVGFQSGITDLYFDYVEVHTDNALVNYGQQLTVLPNGNVGIGIFTPQEKLSVNGKIRVKEVKVEATGWPDYVFKPTHQLPSLTDIEKHIKEKGRLPEIPSAQEVEKNGVDLGEMNKLLLKKIEEITLYLIDLKKENQELKRIVYKDKK